MAKKQEKPKQWIVELAPDAMQRAQAYADEKSCREGKPSMLDWFAHQRRCIIAASTVLRSLRGDDGIHFKERESIFYTGNEPHMTIAIAISKPGNKKLNNALFRVSEGQMYWWKQNHVTHVLPIRELTETTYGIYDFVTRTAVKEWPEYTDKWKGKMFWGRYYDHTPKWMIQPGQLELF